MYTLLHFQPIRQQCFNFGQRVLQIQSNSYHGGQGASLNLNQLFTHLQVQKQTNYNNINNQSLWKVDLTPKCVLSEGYLTKILLRTGVSQYLNWKPISYSLVGMQKNGFGYERKYIQLQKIPTNARQALQSELMGLFEKRRCQKFLEFINNMDVDNPKIKSNINVFKQNASQIINRFDLSDQTVGYIRSFALQSMGNYENKPAIKMIKKIQCTLSSFGVYGDTAHIYPDHGQSKIAGKLISKGQENGVTVKYGEQVQKILFQNKNVVGLETSRGKYKCKQLVCDPVTALKLGLQESVNLIQKVIVGIFLIEKECVKLAKFEGVYNAQIVIPGIQMKSKHDLNILVVSGENFVCPNGYSIAIASKIIQSDKPINQLQKAVDIIKPYITMGHRIVDVYEARSSKIPNLHITNGYHPSYDLQAETQNSMQIYKNITGQQIFLGNVFDQFSWQTIFTYFLLSFASDLEDDLIITVLNFFEFQSNQEDQKQ